MVNATILVCPTAPMETGFQNLSLAFNMLDFIATDLRIKIYAQAHSFAQVAASPRDPSPSPSPNPNPNPNSIPNPTDPNPNPNPNPNPKLQP